MTQQDELSDGVAGATENVHRPRSTVWLLLLFIVLLAWTGCGDGSNTVSVHGHVSYRGEPFEKGLLTFFPIKGRPVIAWVSESGEYRTELAPGEYTVIVRPATEMPEGFKEGDPLPPPKIELPARYTTRVKSRLTAIIRPDQSEPIDFVLE